MSAYVKEPVGGGVDLTVSTNHRGNEIGLVVAGEEISLGQPKILGKVLYPPASMVQSSDHGSSFCGGVMNEW